MGDRYTHAEQIGRIADRLDNLAHALQLPLPAAMHVAQLRAALPEIRDTLRLIYTAEAGDDPWSTHPKKSAASIPSPQGEKDGGGVDGHAQVMREWQSGDDDIAADAVQQGQPKPGGGGVDGAGVKEDGRG